MSAAAGYASRAYAESLSEFGEVVELPRSGGFFLGQAIPGAAGQDAVGPYPLLACRDWNELDNDLAALADRFVCVYGVTDSFAEASPELLAATFPDVCYAYKQHFATDLSRPLDAIVDSHHRRNIRKGLKNVTVQNVSPEDAAALQAWQGLYDCLIERHGIQGIARFSAESFAKQFAVPGFQAFAAADAEGICGMTLWYVDRGVAYYHLGAYNERGYGLAASFAIFSTALQQFAEQGVRWAALGAGAGTNASDSGLTRFKQGWSTETRPVYLCGRILQHETYERLAAAAPAGTKFFPAYRAPRP
ncbi:GNAT family N-acetyltransferase [Lacipirellula sp.]|uniref:GNAT family N-acetyltransferase n=1 Tax=Lacipirellula sp. TaxID=2691419 RepID=UPI003D0F8C41